jgi:3-hydroxyacyl-[acyl-carrier-protein] dehydratase
MTQLDIHKIMDLLPHRYPFLLVDRVIDYTIPESMVAIKNVTFNEPFFQGHFPGRPIMPGVLLLEAMAQVTGLLAFCSMQSKAQSNTMYYLVGVDEARFKKPVVPGDQLIMSAKLEREIKGIYKFQTSATVDGKVVATAKFMTTQAQVAPKA